jgi:hypothetical protein
MLEIIKERTVRKEKSYWINFDCKEDTSCGFIFPANSDETPVWDQMGEEATRNFYECALNFDKYNRWFEEREHTIVEPAVGKCVCGCEVELNADFSYHGAVQCEKCGQWYNLFGQALVDPEYWEDDDDDYYDEDPTDGFMGVTTGSINY